MKEDRPVLVVWELHHLGDALLGIPFFKGAAEHYRTVVVCRSPVAALLRELDLPVEVRECEVPWLDGTGWLEWILDMRRIGREHRPSAAVSVWPDPRVHAVMRLSGASRRISFRVDARNVYGATRPWIRRGLVLGKIADRAARLMGLGGFLTEALEKESSNQAHWTGWRQLAGALSVSWRAELPWIPTEGVIPEEVRAWLEKMKGEGRRVVLVHPGARHPARRWGGYGDVVRNGLFPRGDAVLWIDDGETDPESFTEKTELRTITRPSLQELIGLTRAADLVLANDSFPAHLAAILDRKVVTVFTSQNASWFAPYQNEDGVVQRDVCLHRPCIDHCVMPSFICRDAVTVGDVLEKACRP
jgi:ADP-heptose:LPS heptosyltransferase